MRPDVIRLRRLVIGEAARFPDLARRYYEAVPGRVYDALAKMLAALDRNGRLAIADPDLAAHELAWLIIGWPLDRGMFLDGADSVRGFDFDRVADESVRFFVAGHRSQRGHPARTR